MSAVDNIYLPKRLKEGERSRIDPSINISKQGSSMIITEQSRASYILGWSVAAISHKLDP